jgi:hypothetical protein
MRAWPGPVLSSAATARRDRWTRGLLLMKKNVQVYFTIRDKDKHLT